MKRVGSSNRVFRSGSNDHAAIMAARNKVSAAKQLRNNGKESERAFQKSNKSPSLMTANPTAVKGTPYDTMNVSASAIGKQNASKMHRVRSAAHEKAS